MARLPLLLSGLSLGSVVTLGVLPGAQAEALPSPPSGSDTPAAPIAAAVPTGVEAFNSALTPAPQLISQGKPMAPTPGGFRRRDGFYLQANFAPVQSRGNACDPIGCSSFNSGISGGAALGYQKNNMRVEFEYMNYTNDFKQSTFTQDFPPLPIPGGCRLAFRCTALAGDTQKSQGRAWVQGGALMFNAYYDIPASQRFRPYVGGGFGVYNGNINNLNLPAFSNALGGAVNSNSIYSFAGQIRAGLSYAFTNQLSGFVGYRYFKGAGYTYPLTVNGASIGATIHPNGLASSSLELGLRWLF